MSDKKQTAIDLAFEYFDSISSYVSPEKAKEFNDKRNEFKELEQQQIEDAFEDGANDVFYAKQKYLDGVYYYKKTYQD